MSREDAIKIEGAVVEVFNNRLYRVEFSNGHRLLAHLPNKRRSPSAVSGVRFPSPLKGERAGVRGENDETLPLKVGDRVTVEMSPFDFSKGRISTDREKFI